MWTSPLGQAQMYSPLFLARTISSSLSNGDVCRSTSVSTNTQLATLTPDRAVSTCSTEVPLTSRKDMHFQTPDGPRGDADSLGRTDGSGVARTRAGGAP